MLQCFWGLAPSSGVAKYFAVCRKNGETGTLHTAVYTHILSRGGGRLQSPLVRPGLSPGCAHSARQSKYLRRCFSLRRSWQAMLHLVLQFPLQLNLCWSLKRLVEKNLSQTLVVLCCALRLRMHLARGLALGSPPPWQCPGWTHCRPDWWAPTWEVEVELLAWLWVSAAAPAHHSR